MISSFVSPWKVKTAGMVDRHLRSRIRLTWFFETFSCGLLDALWVFFSKILGVWFMSFSMRKKVLLKVYGHILLFPQIVRKRSY